MSVPVAEKNRFLPEERPRPPIPVLPDFQIPRKPTPIRPERAEEPPLVPTTLPKERER